MTRSALAFAPGRSPLHLASPGVASCFLGSLMAVAFAFSSPLVLVAAGIAVAACGFAAGAGRAVRASLRVAVPLVVVMTAVNAITYHRGDTILLRGWHLPVIGDTDVTLESIVAGASIGLRVVVVIMAFAVYSSCVNPDRVLRALRPLARRSTLTAALVTRLVPMAAADLTAMRECSTLRGPAAEPVGRGVIVRRLVEGSLDRSVDVAATLELRGHSLDCGAGGGGKRSTPGGGLLAAGALIVAVGATALIAGAGGFEAYPSIAIDSGPGTLALCAALPLLALAPFAPWPRPRLREAASLG